MYVALSGDVKAMERIFARLRIQTGKEAPGSINIPTKRSIINRPSKELCHATPLIIAASRCRVEMVKFLRER